MCIGNRQTIPIVCCELISPINNCVLRRLEFPDYIHVREIRIRILWSRSFSLTLVHTSSRMKGQCLTTETELSANRTSKRVHSVITSMRAF